MGRYTLKDWKQARTERERISHRLDNYSGNNPNKHRSDLRQADTRVRIIETSLKADGILPKTERERQEDTLDQLFPNAQSKQIVEYEGQRYQRRFMPLERSRSRKTVTSWDRFWVKLLPGE